MMNVLLCIQAYSSAFEKVLKKEDWYMWAHMKKATISLPIFQSLEAFWPGVQVNTSSLGFKNNLPTRVNF